MSVNPSPNPSGAAPNSDAMLYQAAQHHRRGEIFQAQACAQAALSSARTSWQQILAHIVLGGTLEATKIDEAIGHLRLAVAMAPQVGWPHARYGEALLRAGYWNEGWREFSWYRRVNPDPSNPMAPAPALPEQIEKTIWRGQPLAGKRVFVAGSQTYFGALVAGRGDRIMLARYVPFLVKQGATVLCESPPELSSLLATIPGLLPQSNGAVQADILVPYWELPLHFKTSPNAVPSADEAYLSTDPAKVAAWRKRMGDDRRLRVGIVWCGNPEYTHDAERSTHPGIYNPVAQLPGITLYSLQKLMLPSQTARPSFPIIDYTAELHDFADTAALIANLDLVITTDTSVCHLAGALGARVWTLLSFLPEWRWMTDPDRTVWYRSMRLFRQQTPGDWTGVMNRVVQSLQQLLESRQ